MTVEKKPTRIANLRLVRLPDGEVLELTRGPDTVSSPAVAPDGKHVAFLSDRDIPGAKDLGKTQLWAIPLAGGEAFPVTKLERSVRTFGWVDADTLVYAAQEAPSRWEKEQEEATDTAIVVDDEKLARKLLCEMLKDHPNVEVLCECANGFEAVKAVAEFLSPVAGEVLEVNEEEQWARVQPGVVQDGLSHHVAHLGMKFGPDTATGNRATIAAPARESSNERTPTGRKNARTTEERAEKGAGHPARHRDYVPQRVPGADGPDRPGR